MHLSLRIPRIGNTFELLVRVLCNENVTVTVVKLRHAPIHLRIMFVLLMQLPLYPYLIPDLGDQMFNCQALVPNYI